MRNRNVLWASAAFILCAATVGVAEDDVQQEMNNLLPEVSMAAAQPMPVLVNSSQVNQIPACGDPGNGRKGCSERAKHPPAPKIKRETAKVQASPFQTKTIGFNESGNNESVLPKKLEPGMVLDPPIVLLPETTTTVKLSASDLNRIICPSEVKDAITSDEKGLMIKIVGKDIFSTFALAKPVITY